jgi:hypothetical protein
MRRHDLGHGLEQDRLPLAEGAEERFAAMLITLGRMLRAHGMATLLVRTVSLRLRFQKEPGATTYHSPEMTVGMPGDPRTARVTVERGRCGPTLHIAFPGVACPASGCGPPISTSPSACYASSSTPVRSGRLAPPVQGWWASRSISGS